MGNRSFLYILRPGGEKQEFEQIAEANNTLPSLWQVLLAESVPASTIDCERALGDTGTILIAADAGRGIERYRHLATFIRRDPRSLQVPGLLPYLDAAELFLVQQIERWSIPGKPAPVFCANFDELSWMDDSRPSVFIAHRITEFAQAWDGLQECMRADACGELEGLLGFVDWDMGFEEWIAWSAVFGFCSLGHLYFSGSYKQARETDYARFDPDDDASNGENYLGGGCSRFKQDGKWGVQRWDEHLAPTIVLAPQWDRVLHAGEDEQELVWVQRGERLGLAAISGDNAGCVLRQPDLDATWDYVEGLAIARCGDKMGYLRRDGSWFVEPHWDEAWRYANGYAVVAMQGRHGYLNGSGKMAIAPQFDEADEFGSQGVARVRVGSHYALLREDGSFAVEPAYTQLAWSDDCGGWLTQQNGRCGLLQEDGAQWLAPQWDSIECLARGQLLVVRRASLCGALNWEGQPVLPCEYEDLQPRYPHGVPPAGAVAFAGQRAAHAGASIELIARRDQQAGLIDCTGRVIAPLRFSRIESFEPHSYPPRQQFNRTELLRVHADEPGRSAPAAGVWHIDKQQLIVPCIYDLIWMAKTGRGSHFSFLVALLNAPELVATRGRYSIGVLNADGSTLFEPEYAWIASDIELDAKNALAEVRSALYIEWSAGRPVEASPGKGAASLWLYPDGTHVTHDERLAAKLRRQKY